MTIDIRPIRNPNQPTPAELTNPATAEAFKATTIALLAERTNEHLNAQAPSTQQFIIQRLNTNADSTTRIPSIEEAILAGQHYLNQQIQDITSRHEMLATAQYLYNRGSLFDVEISTNELLTALRQD